MLSGLFGDVETSSRVYIPEFGKYVGMLESSAGRLLGRTERFIDKFGRNLTYRAEQYGDRCLSRVESTLTRFQGRAETFVQHSMREALVDHLPEGLSRVLSSSALSSFVRDSLESAAEVFQPVLDLAENMFTRLSTSVSDVVGDVLVGLKVESGQFQALLANESREFREQLKQLSEFLVRELHEELDRRFEQIETAIQELANKLFETVIVEFRTLRLGLDPLHREFVVSQSGVLGIKSQRDIRKLCSSGAPALFARLFGNVGGVSWLPHVQEVRFYYRYEEFKLLFRFVDDCLEDLSLGDVQEMIEDAFSKTCDQVAYCRKRFQSQSDEALKALHEWDRFRKMWRGLLPESKGLPPEEGEDREENADSELAAARPAPKRRKFPFFRRPEDPKISFELLLGQVDTVIDEVLALVERCEVGTTSIVGELRTHWIERVRHVVGEEEGEEGEGEGEESASKAAELKAFLMKERHVARHLFDHETTGHFIVRKLHHCLFSELPRCYSALLIVARALESEICLFGRAGDVSQIWDPAQANERLSFHKDERLIVVFREFIGILRSLSTHVEQLLEYHSREDFMTVTERMKRSLSESIDTWMERCGDTEFTPTSLISRFLVDQCHPYFPMVNLSTVEDRVGLLEKERDQIEEQAVRSFYALQGSLSGLAPKMFRRHLSRLFPSLNLDFAPRLRRQIWTEGQHLAASGQVICLPTRYCLANESLSPTIFRAYDPVLSRDIFIHRYVFPRPSVDLLRMKELLFHVVQFLSSETISVCDLYSSGDMSPNSTEPLQFCVITTVGEVPVFESTEVLGQYADCPDWMRIWDVLDCFRRYYFEGDFVCRQESSMGVLLPSGTVDVQLRVAVIDARDVEEVELMCEESNLFAMPLLKFFLSKAHGPFEGGCEMEIEGQRFPIGTSLSLVSRNFPKWRIQGVARIPGTIQVRIVSPQS